MKKSTRLLALLLAVIMIMSSMSVLSSAASSYKYTGSTQAEGDASGLVYDDADTLSLTTEQYATMAVDEIDRMLKEEFGSEPIDIGDLGIIFLRLDGIDNALGSVQTIVDNAGALSSFIGTDGTGLINALKNVVNISRKMKPSDNGWAVTNNNYQDDSTESDLLVLYAVLDLLGCEELGTIIDHYVYDNGVNLDLGSLGSLIDAYKFDVRQIAMSALIKVAEVYDNPDFTDSTGAKRKDWDILDDYAKVPSVYTQVGTPENHYSTGALLIANQALVKLVLGDWTKLDPSKVYSETNKTCEVVWSDYYWKDANLNPIPETDPDYGAPNWTDYDYYCYIHEDGLVTAGLGDAIRVPKGPSSDPTNGAGSYSAVNLAEIKTSIKNKTMEGYDYIENLAVQAYNSIAVPLLNRSVVQWLRKEAGFVFLDSKKTKYKKFTKDTTINGKTYKAGEDMRDENGDKVVSETYDYCYLGEDYKKEGYTADHLMEIFNTEKIQIKRYVPVEGETFVQNLNKTLEGIVEQALVVEQGEVLERKADDGIADIEASWSWTTCDNTEENEFADNGNLFKNVCSLVRFILKYTENDFFDSYSISRGEIWSAADIDANAELAASEDAEVSHSADVSLVAYLLRVIINSSTNETYIEYEEDETIASVAYQIAEQFVRQSVPQLMYTKPEADNYGSTEEYDRALLDKALFMLVDLAAYSLGNTMDLNVNDPDDETTYAYSSHNINEGTADNNNTGLLPYLGAASEGNEYAGEDGYKSTANIIAKWALKNYAPLFTFYEIGDENDEEKAQFWKIIDTLINNIIPLRRINDSTPGWLDESIDNNRTEDTFIEEVLINYLIMPILELDNTGKIFRLFAKGNDTQFSYQGEDGEEPSMDLEGVIVKVLGLIFNDLFYGSFDDVAMVDLDTIINNNNLAGFLKRLLASLGAHSKYEGRFNGEDVTVTGRGKQILYVGLPVAAMILGLADKQEFSELENYIPDVIKANQTKQTLYNGSTGLNTSYLDNNGTRYVDCLYNFEITAKTQTDLTTGTASTITLNKTTLAGGEMAEYQLSGLTNGHVYKIQFTYDVYGETGKILAEDLTSTKYVYVGSESDASADYSDANGNTYTYAKDIYTTGVPSTGWSIGFKQNDNAAGSVQVTNAVLKDPNGAVVNGYTIESETDDNGTENRNVKISNADRKGSYTLKPYTIAEGVNLQKETYVYKKDADGKVIYKNGLPEIAHVMTTEEYLAANPGKDAPTWLKNGNYTLETTIVASGVEQKIVQDIHLYEEFGLESLFNNEVEKNYTAASLANQGYFTTYSDALNKVAQFVLTAKATGKDFTDDVLDSTISGINSEYGKLYGDVTNKYAQYYSYLNGVIGNLQLNSSGADALADALDEMIGITRYEETELELSDGNTVTFNMPVKHEYYEINDDTGLPYDKFVSQIDYTGAAFETFRKARNDVQDLIARDKNYTGVDFSITQEEYNASSAAEQAAYNQKIYAWINSTGKNIGSTEETMAIAKLNLAWERLQNYKIYTSGKMNLLNNVVFDENSPYYIAYDNLDSYAKQGAKNFRNAMDFADKIYQGEIDEEFVTLDMVIEAVNNVVYYYKRLVIGADTSALAEAIEDYALSEGKEATYYDEGGSEVTDTIPYLDDSWTFFVYEDDEDEVPHFIVNPELGGADYAGKWDFDSYANFIAVLAEACEAYYEKDWAESQQEEVDAITAKLYKAMEDLKGNAEVEEPTEDYTFVINTSTDVSTWSTEAVNTILNNPHAWIDEDTGIFMGYTEQDELFWYPTIDKVTMFKYAPIVDEYYGIADSPADVNFDEYVLWPTVDYNGAEINVNGYIFGISPESTEADIKALFSNLENCAVVIKGVENSGSTGYGTGTVVFITNTDKTEVKEAYILVYRSDLTGDGKYDSDDKQKYNLQMAKMILLEEDPSTLAFLMAADVNGDLKISAEDQTCIMYKNAKKSRNGVSYIDIWQPAGNLHMNEYPANAK